jgi:hypothetical protein
MSPGPHAVMLGVRAEHIPQGVRYIQVVKRSGINGMFLLALAGHSRPHHRLHRYRRC